MTANPDEQIVDLLTGPLVSFAREVAETFAILPIDADDPIGDILEEAERESAEGALRKAVDMRIEQYLAGGSAPLPAWARKRAFERLWTAYSDRRREVRAAPQVEGRA